MTHDFHDNVMTPAITITSPGLGHKDTRGEEKPNNRAILTLINHCVLLGRVKEINR